MTLTQPTGAQTRARHLALAASAAGPERVVLVTVALALAAGGMVSLGIHYWWTVLPTAIALSALLWRPLASRTPVTVAAARGGAIALGGTALWVLVNIAIGAEFLLVVRDPGFLTLSGMWLADHPHTDIPAAGAVEAAAFQPHALPDASEAWNLKGQVIQPQGAKMLPATIAIGGWIAGDAGVLAANTVIGAVGILAVYAVARRFLGPLAALAPAGALALTVSHIGLSRPAYTEPLTLLLVIAGILWAWRGIHERSLVLLGAGAVATGATSFIRIDGAASAVGALLGVMVALALSYAHRRWRKRAALMFVSLQALVLALGYLALARWSTEYLERLAEQTTMVLTLYAAVVVAMGLWALLWTRHIRADRLLGAASDALGKRGAQAVGVAVVAVMLGFASRPLWMMSHRGTEDPRDQFTNNVVESFQAAQGLPIEPTRTYAESTVTWLSFYLTWPLVLLGILGLSIAAYRMVRRDGGWAVFCGAIMAPTLVYLWRPAIVPDQLWAIRRFEPATLPGMVLAAALAAWALVALVKRESVRVLLRRCAGGVFLLLPLTTWVSIHSDAEYPVTLATNVSSREMSGAHEQLDELCAIEPGRPIVLVGTSSHFGSLRVMCDVPVVLSLSPPTVTELADMARVWDQAPVVLTQEQDSVPWSSEPHVVVTSRVTQSAYALQRLPRTHIERNYRWYAGVIATSGVVEPVTTTGDHSATQAP